VFGRGTGGFSFPNDRLLWWWRLVGGFLSELERNGVVDVSVGVGVRRDGASVDSNPFWVDLFLTGRSRLLAQGCGRVIG